MEEDYQRQTQIILGIIQQEEGIIIQMVIMLEIILLEEESMKQISLGTEEEIALKRKYSFSDRCRYYLPVKEVNTAINILIDNFKDGVPLNLLSQFLPRQYTKVREGIIENNPECIIKDHIIDTINDYLYATKQELIK